MAVSLLLLAAVIAVVHGRPEVTDGLQNEEVALETIATGTYCSIDLQLVYPSEEGEPPYPSCSVRCRGGEELWIDGVDVKKMSVLEEYALLVEITYKNGSMQDCKIVSYDIAENTAARPDVRKPCMDSFCPSDKDSQDGALVPSVTEIILDAGSSIPMHQRLEGFTQVGSSYYMVSPGVMSWHDAVKYCNQLGASLAFIESPQEQDHLKGVLSADVWIGLSDIVAEGIFVNAGHTVITYSNWKPGEPNERNTGEDCVMMFGSQQLLWNDYDCNTQIHALCEHRLDEVPQAQYTCPQGYWQHKSSCYILASTADTYSRGEEFCATEKAYPVFINSQEEHNFLAGKLSAPTFIGYSDRAVEGTFLSNRFGIPLFKRWGHKEPNDGNSNEDCVSIESRFQHIWNDVSCDSLNTILCEKAAEIRDYQSFPLHGGSLQRQALEIRD